MIQEGTLSKELLVQYLAGQEELSYMRKAEWWLIAIRFTEVPGALKALDIVASLQKWLKNPRMTCASQSRSNPGKPRSRSPKNRSVIGTKRQIQNRPNPRISATRKPPNLWFFFLHTRKVRVNQIKVVRRGSKCTWLEIRLGKKKIQNKKPRKVLEHVLQSITWLSFI